MGKNRFVFDMDGTLYGLDSGSFKLSSVYRQIKNNIYLFLSGRLGITPEAAASEYENINLAYNGHASIGFEKEFGIDRYDYFNNTWNINPDGLIQPDDAVKRLFKTLAGRVAVLTNAPRVWAVRALDYLGIYDDVSDALFTGEPDIRKPNPLAFRRVIDFLKVGPEQAVSVGNEVEEDILPAKKLGMKTVLVGSFNTQADFCLDSVGGLLNIIETGNL
ncbi:HAD hydrolase-like protein [archaeon]|nr:HAD hydrolase-like protein [archaeon]